MTPPEQEKIIAEVDLSGFSQQDIEAIEKVATERGLSFDDACLQLLLERSRELRVKRGPGLFALLFGIGAVH